MPQLDLLRKNTNQERPSVTKAIIVNVINIRMSNVHVVKILH